MSLTIEKIKSVMIGHAIGDALGVPVEFCSREQLSRSPVTTMMGFGTYPVPAGAWSDDTSMALCSLESLAKGTIDLNDIMLNFGKWYYKDEFTPTGEMFDVGNTCSYAIDNYFAHKKSCMECGLTDERSNGNGSLMRIHPAALYIADMNISIEDKVAVIEMVSALTHAHNRSKMGCGIYSFVLWELLDKPNKVSIISGLRKAHTYYFKTVKSPEYQHYHELLFRRTACLFRHFEDYDTFRPATKDEIKSSGYVVDSLTAAIWCLLNTSTYEDCVLEAVNLGDDTDTIAAIAGGLAGALYGYEAVPQNWKDTLLRCDYIEDMCERAWNKWKE